MVRIKKFFLSKSIPNWVPVIFVIALAIFAACGWKIIYAPQLENNWSAIDAVGGWASAVISGVAIWFAVSAPKRIARRQNDIALFEMRFSCYNIYLKYISFAEMIREIDTPDRLCQVFSFNFMGYDSIPDIKESVMIVKSDEQQLMSGLFLFSNSCDGKTIQGILQGMLEVISLMQKGKENFSKEDKAKVASFCDKCKSFKDEYMGKMRRQLVLSDA